MLAAEKTVSFAARRVHRSELGARQYRHRSRPSASWCRRSGAWPGRALQNYPLQPTSAIVDEAIMFEPLPALCAG